MSKNEPGLSIQYPNLSEMAEAELEALREGSKVKYPGTDGIFTIGTVTEVYGSDTKLYVEFDNGFVYDRTRMAARR